MYENSTHFIYCHFVNRSQCEGAVGDSQKFSGNRMKLVVCYLSNLTSWSCPFPRHLHLHNIKIRCELLLSGSTWWCLRYALILKFLLQGCSSFHPASLHLNIGNISVINVKAREHCFSFIFQVKCSWLVCHLKSGEASEDNVQCSFKWHCLLLCAQVLLPQSIYRIHYLNLSEYFL